MVFVEQLTDQESTMLIMREMDLLQEAVDCVIQELCLTSGIIQLHIPGTGYVQVAQVVKMSHVTQQSSGVEIVYKTEKKRVMMETI